MALSILSRPRPRGSPDRDLPVSLRVKCLVPRGARPAGAKVSILSLPGAQSGSISFQRLTAGRRLPGFCPKLERPRRCLCQKLWRNHRRRKSTSMSGNPRADLRWREPPFCSRETTCPPRSAVPGFPHADPGPRVVGF